MINFVMSNKLNLNNMKPIIITGTCKELYNCERLLKRFGYIPRNCYLKTADNHECGFILINREGEFTFFSKNPYPNYTNTVTASDFMKNYGALGIRTCYTFKNIYLVVTLILFMTGIESSEPLGQWILVGLLSLNIVFYWKKVREWVTNLN